MRKTKGLSFVLTNPSCAPGYVHAQTHAQARLPCVCLDKPHGAYARMLLSTQAILPQASGRFSATAAAGAPCARLLRPQQLCPFTVSLPLTVTPHHPRTA